MRLWHKALIPYLPRQQLIGQWRECCCIAKNIADNGTPNHILVNKIMDYPADHFTSYGLYINKEMEQRGYKCDLNKFMKYRNTVDPIVPIKCVFYGWHNKRYLKQCLYNLEEKYDCGGINKEEWKLIKCFGKKENEI